MSNKTPNENDAKTGSAPKLTSYLTLLAVLLIVAGLGWASYRLSATSACELWAADPYRPSRRQCIALERADTLYERQQGLSGRPRLGQYAAMLFVFDQPEPACMWMKDMNFPLDIVWLDEQRQITKVMSSVQPQTYPETFCQEGSSYVIELNAGMAEAAGLAVGRRVNLR